MYASEEAVRNSQWNAAQMAFATEEERQRPSVLYRPRLSLDGNMWCALYGENILEGCAGFGPTPAAAMKAFDEAWTSPAPKKRAAP
jgi:hypothetical protein